jgi:hypothetical protein
MLLLSIGEAASYIDPKRGDLMWTQQQRDRLVLEHRLLQSVGLTQFGVYHDRDRDEYYGLGTTQTNVRSSYDLWIPIPSGYPDQRPPLYVWKPNPLPTSTGGTVNDAGLSHAMHTLKTGPRGVVQICHWRDARWHAGITLDKVLLKGLIWLEAYEQHLSTGKSIDSFVRTMTEAR